MKSKTEKRVADEPVMIFHAPYPMEMNPTSASRLRPLRMREAFAELGYTVVDMSGTTPERRRKLKKLRKLLRDGMKPDFLYSENSTQPNVFATSVKAGLAPFLDYEIIRTAHKSHVPTGVFYRDIYWRFQDGPALSLIGKVSPFFHKMDMRGYLKNDVHFFLPSENVADCLGLDSGTAYSALPPGGDSGCATPLPDGPLTLFYVGGIGKHYNLDCVVSAVTRMECIRLEIVTKQDQWEAAIAANPSLRSSALNVYHLNANELAPLYAKSHIGVLMVEPSRYRQFAVPAKLFEYIAHGRPVLATAGTEAARIVAHFDAGWVVEYSEDAIANLLEYLVQHPEEVRQKSENASVAARSNTWTDRARTVADVLTGRR